MNFRPMVVLCSALLWTVASLSFSGQAVAGETYKIDTGHSSILFKVKHLGIGESYGRFNDFSGTMAINLENPSSSKVEVKVNAESIDTASEKRDKHLRSPDFFNVKQFAEIAFSSTEVMKKDGSWVINGNLTFMGKTKAVTITLQETGAGKDPWGNFRRGWHGTTTIKRSEYGMKYGIDKEILGDDVEIIFSLEGIRG